MNMIMPCLVKLDHIVIIIKSMFFFFNHNTLLLSTKLIISFSAMIFNTNSNATNSYRKCSDQWDELLYGNHGWI